MRPTLAEFLGGGLPAAYKLTAETGVNLLISFHGNEAGATKLPSWQLQLLLRCCELLHPLHRAVRRPYFTVAVVALVDDRLYRSRALEALFLDPADRRPRSGSHGLCVVAHVALVLAALGLVGAQCRA